MTERMRAILDCLEGTRELSNGQWEARCPVHADKQASLSLKQEGDGTILIFCHRCGKIAKAVMDELRLPHSYLFPESVTTGNEVKAKPRRKIVATYDYTDADGKRLYQVVRYQPKDFRQRRPDPEDPDKWLWNLEGVQRVLYRLPEIAKAKPDHWIFVVEGEKDADALAKLGLCATTCPQGTDSWELIDQEPLRGRKVCILPDNDLAGIRHAAGIAWSLEDLAKQVMTLRLPGLADKGDVSDWIAAGGTAKKLIGLIGVALGKGSASKDLMDLGRAIEAFHSPDEELWARVKVGNHHETMRITDRRFKQWLVGRYFEAHEKPPSAQAVADTLTVLENDARTGPCHEVYVRLAPCGPDIYLDLADAAWRAARITSEGWSIVKDPPVKFRRSRTMMPLPAPTQGGDIEALRKFVNVFQVEDWTLIKAWLLGALRPNGPYPILCVGGEQGSAKSTLCRLLRRVIDPSHLELRSPPRSEQDLVLATLNSRVVAIDNVSTLPPWLSDALCRIATGGGFATRELYTTTTECVVRVCSPVILNGIESAAQRPDLIDRSMCLSLPRILDDDRKTEESYWRAFDKVHAGVLGALLDAACVALKRRPDVVIEKCPRMADWAAWVVAGAPALGFEDADFLAAHNDNQEGGSTTAIEAELIAEPLLHWIAEHGDYEGTAGDMLAILSQSHPELAKKRRWPVNAASFSGALTRLAPSLRRYGVDVIRTRSGKRRKMTIKALPWFDKSVLDNDGWLSEASEDSGAGEALFGATH